ncbi:MAG: Shedu anti-phage system protein SduA domain-containing protein [Solirubrobacteraceae bacterium]
MVYEDWRSAYTELRHRSGNVDDTQLALGRTLELRLARRLPATVAAALIRERLAGPLRASPSRPPSHEQLEYLNDLVDRLEMSRPKPTETREQVSAWLTALEDRRAARALRALKPTRGDVVFPVGEPDDVGTVTSISDNGRINVAGPGGRGIRPHDAMLAARRGDSSADARDARQRAANRAAARARTNQMPSQRAMTALDAYRVADHVERSVVTELETTIDTARDERPIQAYIERHPEILTSLSGPTSLGTFVRSQPSLGGQRFPDFALAVADSAGLHWTLIEIESPRAAIGLQNGQLAKNSRAAVGQVETWREWLTNNLDTARRPRAQDGLGLTDVRPEAAGIVLIGRRAGATPLAPAVQRRLHEEQQIQLHSYDWLLDALNRKHNRPGGPLDWADSSEISCSPMKSRSRCRT